MISFDDINKYSQILIPSLFKTINELSKDIFFKYELSYDNSYILRIGLHIYANKSFNGGCTIGINIKEFNQSLIIELVFGNEYDECDKHEINIISLSELNKVISIIDDKLYEYLNIIKGTTIEIPDLFIQKLLSRINISLNSNFINDNYSFEQDNIRRISFTNKNNETITIDFTIYNKYIDIKIFIFEKIITLQVSTDFSDIDINNIVESIGGLNL